MGNAAICSNVLVTASDAVMAASSAAANYGADNLQVHQPGETWRTTTVAGENYAQVTFGTIKEFDLCGLLYTNVTPHRNLLQQSNTMNTSPWSKTNVTVLEANDKPILGSGAGEVCKITDDATSGFHRIFQSWTTPSAGLANLRQFTLSTYVASDSANPISECRLNLRDNGANSCFCVFDLSAGTAGTPGTTGANPWTGLSATITEITEGAFGPPYTAYRLTLTGSAAINATSIQAYLYLMDGLGNASYSGSGDILWAETMQLELGATATGATVTTTDSGSIFRISRPSDDQEIVAWQHCTQKNQRDWPWVHLVHRTSSTTFEGGVVIKIFDTDNADGYIEAGNLVVGKDCAPAQDIGSGWSLGWNETGVEMRGGGGQLFRPVNKRSRSARLTWDWGTEAEMWSNLFDLDRVAGRSEGVLISVNPDSATYRQEWTLYGVQNLQPLVHRTYSTSEAAIVYRKDYEFIEVLP